MSDYAYHQPGVDQSLADQIKDNIRNNRYTGVLLHGAPTSYGNDTPTSVAPQKHYEGITSANITLVNSGQSLSLQDQSRGRAAK